MDLWNQIGDLASATLLLAGLLGAAALGQYALPRLPEHHRSRETLEVVRLVSSYIVTFAALVLGLLTASVNSAFYQAGNDMNALAGSIRQADLSLRAYGTDADPARAALLAYAARVVAATWPEEGGAPAAAPSPEAAIEGGALDDALQTARSLVLGLDPPDALRKRLAAICADDLSKIVDLRWRLVAEAHDTISVPFYRVLVLMLLAVFASFGLGGPRNWLTWVTIGLGAFTIATSVFVVLELDGPLDGFIKVSSASMRAALARLGGS